MIVQDAHFTDGEALDRFKDGQMTLAELEQYPDVLDLVWKQYTESFSITGNQTEGTTHVTTTIRENTEKILSEQKEVHPTKSKKWRFLGFHDDWDHPLSGKRWKVMESPDGRIVRFRIR